MSVRTISELIPDQLPGFIRDEAPLFESFLKAYYEFAEQENESIGAMRHLEKNFDIDEASLAFVEYFRREVINEIPQSALADPRILVKNIRQLYKAKGSQNAYKFLFRLLYDADVEFFYPGEKILRASDGRWTTQQTLRLQLTQGTASALGGETIIGSTNGGRAIVEDFISTTELGVSVITARLSGVSGEFENDEPFQTPDGSIQGIVFARIGGVSAFAIEDGGGQHQTGDTVAISGAGGIGARATVATVTDQSAVTFEIKEGGSGYRANVIYSTSESAGNFENPAITGGSGQGASFRVTSITDTQNLSLNTDKIVELQNVLIGADPFSAGPEGANITPTLASSNAFSQLQNALTFETSGTIGSIDEIEVLDPGFGYSTLPSVSVVDFVVQDFLGAEFPDDTGVGGFKGSNAVIVANNMPGAIETLTVTVPGSSYDRQQEADVTNLDRANTFPATGFATPTALSNVEGFYVDTNRGILGGDNVLQDNFFYQEYSYVLRTPINTSVYRAVLDKLLHPSGTKFFSEVQIRSEISFPVTVESIQPEVEINIEDILDVTPLVTNIEVIASEISVRTPVEIGPADVTQTTFDVVESQISFRLDDVGDIASTAVVTEGTTVGSPTEPELVLFIEEAGAIESTVFIAGDVPIEPFEDVVIGASPNTYADDGNFAAEDQVTFAEFAISDEDSRIGDALGLHALRPLFPLDQSIDPTVAFGTTELVLTIEEAGAIASTAVVTADTGVGSPSEPEVVNTIEEVGAIASTVTFSGQDTISPMADVELNQSPFSNDPDIGDVTPELGGADVNTQISTAIPGITVSHV